MGLIVYRKVFDRIDHTLCLETLAMNNEALIEKYIYNILRINSK